MTVVTFSISNMGRIANVSVSTVSGDATLDTIAHAINRTTFSKPSSGMSEAQLIYIVPFHFR